MSKAPKHATFRFWYLRTGRTAEVSTTISSDESKQIFVILAAKDVQRYRQFEAEENFQVSILAGRFSASSIRTAQCGCGDGPVIVLLQYTSRENAYLCTCVCARMQN